MTYCTLAVGGREGEGTRDWERERGTGKKTEESGRVGGREGGREGKRTTNVESKLTRN